MLILRQTEREREREHRCTRRGGTERQKDGERECQALPCSQHCARIRVGLELTNEWVRSHHVRSWPELKVRVKGLTDWATQAALS